jgi:hypothetical protein
MTEFIQWISIGCFDIYRRANSAVISTVIVIIAIPVIAYFALCHHTIATGRHSAVAVAAVAVLLIAIVARFGKKVYQTISTRGELARLQAVVVVIWVAVITLFLSFDDTITTSIIDTGGGMVD